jgi:hypothetical protein
MFQDFLITALLVALGWMVYHQFLLREQRAFYIRFDAAHPPAPSMLDAVGEIVAEINSRGPIEDTWIGVGEYTGIVVVRTFKHHGFEVVEQLFPMPEDMEKVLSETCRKYGVDRGDVKTADEIRSRGWTDRVPRPIGWRNSHGVR